MVNGFGVAVCVEVRVSAEDGIIVFAVLGILRR